MHTPASETPGRLELHSCSSGSRGGARTGLSSPMEFLWAPGVSSHGAKHKVQIRFMCRLVARQLRNNAHATERTLQQLLAHDIIATSGVFYDSSLLHAAFDVQCLCRPSACGAETSFGVSSAEIQNKLAGASSKINIVDAVCHVSSPLRS